MSSMSKQTLAKSLDNDDYMRELCTSALSRVLRHDLRSRFEERNNDEEGKKESSNLISSLIDALGTVMANQGQDKAPSSTGYLCLPRAFLSLGIRFCNGSLILLLQIKSCGRGRFFEET